MSESPRGIAYRRAWVAPRGDRERPRMLGYAVAMCGRLDHVVEGEVRMNVTDAMVAAFVESIKDQAGPLATKLIYSASMLGVIRKALETALADVPETVPRPFGLSDQAITVCRKLSLGIACDTDDCAVLSRELDRAVRTLVAPAVEPMPEEYSEEQVQAALRAWFADPDSIDKNGDMRAALAAAGVRGLHHAENGATVPQHADLEDYRNAPSGIGPHAFTWKDKPHRLVYDLVKQCKKLRKEFVRRAEENEKP